MNTKSVKRFFKSILASSMAISSLSLVGYSSINDVSAIESEESYTQYVDPFVCTDVDYGQLFPGSVVPNGLVKLSPDTYPHNTLDHAGYDYSKLQISGFSHTRIEGVGGQGAGGDVLVTPTYVQYTARPNAATRAMSYSKDNESAKPGYYSVELIPNKGTDKIEGTVDGKIKAELTTDQRTGFHQYTFPAAGNVNVLVDLNYTYHGTDVRDAILDVLEQSDKTTALGGRFSGRNVGGNGKYTMYFYMETSKPTKDVKTWNGNSLSNKLNQKGNDLGAILNFDVKAGEVLQLKVSISPISVEQAKIDMHNEISNWDFNAAYQRADQQWDDVLSKIKIETSQKSDPTGELKQLFYTHLYHMFMTPVNATSTSGTYRGTDGNVYEADDYTHYDSWTLWDDYRKYPMIGLVMPDIYKDMVRSIADALEHGIVTWSHDKQPVPNVRTEHAVALLADGVAKGFTDIDNLEEAYEEAKKIANKVITQSVEELGYVDGRMDRTMEYGYDDWTLSLIADALAKADEAEYFLNRSFMYKNLYRPNAVQSPFSEKKLGLIWNKKNGNWSTSSPTKIGADGLYQGSMWQYSWYCSNDVNGLMDLMGGKEYLLEALQYMFGEHAPDEGSAMLHNAANEVELHLPYLFNFAGRPDKTQYWVRQIYTKETWNTGYASGAVKEKMYKLSPKGYLETMDDDAGTMAMMFVSAAMGIFPMTPGDTTFQIGSPFFEKVTLDVGNGKTFTIEAKNVSEDNFYIQSAAFNGQTFERTWLDYSEITRGGVLSLEMGSTPSTWAQNGVPAKSSSDAANTAIYDDDEIAYSTAMLEESKSNDGSFDQKIEITLKTNEFTGDINEDLTTLGKIKITNVPEGLKASAVKVADNKVEISLDGKAKHHKLNDSIGDLTIEITDTATKIPITGSIRKTKDNIKVMFIDDRLTYSTTELKESQNDDGAIVDTAIITLSGDSTFAGKDNENFVETGKVQLTNIPEGLTAKVIKTGDKRVILSFEGKAKAHQSDVEFELSFTDEAFAGAKAAEVEKSACGGMTALLLDFSYDAASNLMKTIAEAELIKPEEYTISSYESLQAAIAEGKELLEKGDLSRKEITVACNKIISAMEKLKMSVDALTRIEAEKSDAWTDARNPHAPNDAVLKNEGDVIGGTFDGAWIRYDSIDFSGLNIKSIDVRYCNNSGRCPEDAKLEVRLDAFDGELITTVNMPSTGSSWGVFGIVSQVIDEDKLAKLDGIHDVYFVMKGSTTDTRPFIGNIDYMQFKESTEVEEITSVKLEAEKSNAWSGGSLKNESINLGGTYDNAWIQYNNVDFSKLKANTIHVRYSTRVDACALDSRIEIREGNKDGQLLGTIDLPLTDGWSDYQIVTTRLDTSLSGTHTLCFVLRGTTGNGRPYIANIDYMEFEKSVITKHIEAEEAKDNWSGNGLKTETSTDADGNSLVNIGGTTPNCWLKYNQINFDEFDTKDISIRYVNNSGRCKPDGKLEFYLDNMEGQPVFTVAIPSTGNNWNAYKVILESTKTELSGTHDLYVVMRGSQGSNPYIANLDWIEFGDLGADEGVDKTELQALYDANKALLQQSKTYHYIGFNIFKDAMLGAGNVLDNEKATENDVRVAIKNINNALQTLQYQIIFDLNDLIIDMESIKEVDYTKDSYVKLVKVIDNAKAIEDGSEYAVYEEAYNAVVEAHSQLTVLDRTHLIAIIEKAEAIDLDQYLDQGKETFIKALENAKNVLSRISLTQKEVDEAIKVLDDAINALERIPETVSKDELKDLVDLVKRLDEDNYTKETWTVLESQLKNAQNVLDNENVTQEEVDEAFKLLQEACNGLKIKDDTPEDPKPEEPNQPGNGESNNRSVSTGDQNLIEFYIGIGMLSLLSASFIKRKRED